MIPALITVSILAAAPAYRPFLDPLPVWSDKVWPWLLIPLCLAVSVVYKSVKCRSMRQVPRESISITGWILAGMIAAAVVLAGVVKVLEWR